MRRLPPFVLLEALDRAATLRSLGEDEIGGKRQKVISVVRPDNQLLTLSFDAQTNLLTRYGYLYTDPAGYADWERELFEIGLKSVLYPADGEWGRLVPDLFALNRRLLNLLASTRCTAGTSSTMLASPARLARWRCKRSMRLATKRWPAH